MAAALVVILVALATGFGLLLWLTAVGAASRAATASAFLATLIATAALVAGCHYIFLIKI